MTADPSEGDRADRRRGLRRVLDMLIPGLGWLYYRLALLALLAVAVLPRGGDLRSTAACLALLFALAATALDQAARRRNGRGSADDPREGQVPG